MTLKPGAMVLKIHHSNKLHFKVYSNIKSFIIKTKIIPIIFHNIAVSFCIFDQRNATLMSIRDFLKKNIKICTCTHARTHSHTHTHMLVFMVYGDSP